MAKFYITSPNKMPGPKNKPKIKIGYYGERGPISFLLGNLIPQNPEGILGKIELADGASFYRRNVEKSGLNKIACLTELHFGVKGFGVPDGALFVETNDNKIWVFLEAKRKSYSKSVAQPGTKNFNSSINGQLELRWRLVNAICPESGERGRISEQDVVLSDAYKGNDCFYKERKGDNDWRKVRLKEGVKEIHEKFLRKTDDFYYFVITLESDGKNPFSKNEEHLPRLYDKEGKKVSWRRGKRLFGWYNFSELESELKT